MSQYPVQVNRMLAITNLKSYFAVDTNYVLRKLSILLFPFSHRNWMLQYVSDSPVPPREDVNAPDLYIPGGWPSPHTPLCVCNTHIRRVAW